jgi:hypothetical protein
MRNLLPILCLMVVSFAGGPAHALNGERVCFDNQDFASYASVERRAVADVIDGRLQVIATCAINSGRDTECPATKDAGARTRWNFEPTAEQRSIADGSAKPMKLDPELAALDDDDGWLNACLTENSFPAPISTEPRGAAR